MIHFELVTLSGTKFGQEVYEVVLPTEDGYIGVFKNHMPLVSLATHGVITIRHKDGDPDNKLTHYATNGGVINIHDNSVQVLVDEADHEEEINEQEIKKAIERAHKLRAEAKDQVSLDHAQSMIDRQAVRLKVAEIRRRKPRSRSSS